MRSFLFICFLVLLLALNATFVASCLEDDDDDDAASSVDDDDDDADDDDDDDDDNDDTAGAALGGIATDFLSDEPVPTATIELVDNDTGLSFNPPITGSPDAYGYVELTAPAGVTVVAVKFTDPGNKGTKKYKDTYQYDFPVGQYNETFLGVSEPNLIMFAGLLDIDLDGNKGHAFGDVYWDDGTSAEQPVGCATVDYNPASNAAIRYFTDRGLPSPSRIETNPLNGWFVAINADPIAAPGYETTATAYDGVTTASLTLPAMFADSVCIQTIVFDTEPPGCP